ncbi:uncharacterized protein EDB91DRAFT_1245731 [Suillus paluster]|uniref:uncharacterized protein n=1 Tax=Suillus paluster TaxID=48578 RepID=UPI001B860DD4|nr:uncharacterized protein EDB91DRAFT_1245731 [Suillus paluster]KAG1746539.1 hypothetical protein EDB91DRAFT_1245731 [Suillus paluster]
MRAFVLSCVIALVLSVSSAVAASTNAQRLARGLPVLPPKFGRALPGYAWTPTAAGARQSPSPSSPKKCTGRILVKRNDGESLGHLYNWASGISEMASTLVPQARTCMYRSPGLYLEKGLSTYRDSASPESCYIGTTSNDTLAPGSPTAVGFGNVIRTPVHSPPVPVGHNQADESAIWTFDPKTNELKVHYVNLNGHKANTIIAYKAYDNTIFFVGDIGTYNAAQVNPDYKVSPVTFYLDV